MTDSDGAKLRRHSSVRIGQGLTALAIVTTLGAGVIVMAFVPDRRPHIIQPAWTIEGPEAVLLAMAVGHLFAARFLPGWVANRFLNSSDPEAVERAREQGVDLYVVGYQSSVIVRVALLEAVALVAIIVYTLQRTAIPVVVTGIVLGYLLIWMPTEARQSRWMDQFPG